MKKLLVLGSTYGNREAILYAKSLGVFTIVTDYLPFEQSPDKVIADEHWNISTADIPTLVEKCREEQVDSVVNIVSDFNINKAAILSRELNIPFYTDEETFKYSLNKRAFKDFCIQSNIPVPKDYYLSNSSFEHDLNKIDYPVVVKPIDMAGNIGLSYCHNPQELASGYKNALEKSKSGRVVIEQMLSGDEWYSIYAFSNGEVRHIALNAMYSQPGFPACCYSITTTVSSWINRWLKEINPRVEKMLKKMGCREGACFVQGMSNNNEIYVLEMGYRLDGDTMFIPYKELLNTDLVKYITNYSLNGKSDINELPSSQTGPFDRCACSYMLWTKQSGTISAIEGLDRISRIKGVDIVQKVFPGSTIEQYKPIGNILFVTDTCKEMCKMIDLINKNVKVLDADGNDMLIRFTDFERLLRNNERQY